MTKKLHMAEPRIPPEKPHNGIHHLVFILFVSSAMLLGYSGPVGPERAAHFTARVLEGWHEAVGYTTDGLSRFLSGTSLGT